MAEVVGDTERFREEEEEDVGEAVTVRVAEEEADTEGVTVGEEDRESWGMEVLVALGVREAVRDTEREAVLERLTVPEGLRELVAPPAGAGVTGTA